MGERITRRGRETAELYMSENGQRLLLAETYPADPPMRGYISRTVDLTEHFEQCIRRVLDEREGAKRVITTPDEQTGNTPKEHFALVGDRRRQRDSQ